jgi:hypothetical protein
MLRPTLAALLLAVPAAALAKDFTQDTATHTWTAVSGVAGDFVAATFASDKALRMMFFKEKTDDPRQIDVNGQSIRSVDAGSGGSTGLQTLEIGGGAGGSTQVVDVGDLTYVTAIQVCTTDKKESFDDKLKGVKAWGATLRADGTLQPNPTPVKFERTNCAKWRAKVECPAGAIATALRAHYQFDKTGFSGLSLRCTKLK